MLFAISGIDGSGKSTCANVIKGILESNNEKAIIIDAMKNGIFFDALKNSAIYQNDDLRNNHSPELINLVWTSDLIYNYETKVRSYINNGYNVILHRSELCCRVYSKLFASRSSYIDDVLDNYHFKYDMCFFIDIHPNLALKRIRNRAGCGVVTEKETLLNLNLASELYKGYLALPQYHRVQRIDGALQIADIKKDLEIHIKKMFL